jgi:alpha-mannosidase
MEDKKHSDTPMIFLVPHSHYDVVWAMTKIDYLNIHKKLLRQALEMIEKSDFKFLIEQTYLLEQIETEDPQLYADITKAIVEGRIEIADGEYLMPDPMIPAEEVLVREILMGKTYVKDKFGLDVPVAWMSDGFGLNGQLPQIYKKSGYKWLAFRRGLPKSIGTRTSEFIWEGIDGTRITAHWMPLGYRAGLDLDKWDENYAKLARLSSSPNILMPCGSGGMLIQEEIPAAVEKWNQSNRGARMIIATPREFFEALEQTGEPSTIYHGELYSAELEDIFPDVVSSRISLKLAIRECEDLMKSMEKAASLAYMQGNRYPRGRLNEAWKKMLFLAFHDVMPSCGIDEIYEEAWEYVKDIKKMASTFYRSAVDSIPVDQSRGVGIMVFNPHSWEITDWVEVELELGTGWSKEPGVYFDGREIVSEASGIERWDDDTIQRVKLGFVATVPQLGYRIYEIRPKSKRFRSKKIKIKENEISTKFFNLRIDPSTGILEVFDKEGQEILKGNEVVIDAELGDLYFHKNDLNGCIGSEGGEGIRFGAFKPQELKIERGAIRTVITFRNAYHCLRWPYYLTEKFKSILYRHKTLDIFKQVIVYENIPRIDFFTEIDSNQSHVRIRLKFDTCMAAPIYTRETQFGAIELPPVRTMEEGVKMPSLTWLSADDRDRGLAFLTKGVPINEVIGGEIYCTLLRSVSVLSSDGVSGPLIPTPGAMELGKHSYHYSVYPHKGDWKQACVPREAYRFGEGLVGFKVDRLPTPRDYATFCLEPDNLVISALKKAEKEEALILRLFETDGRACHAKLRIPDHIHTARPVNLIEEDVEDGNNIHFKKGLLEFDVRPFEIVTLKMLFGKN